MCEDCKGTGVALVYLTDTVDKMDCAVQRCDTCRVLTDSQAIGVVENLLKQCADRLNQPTVCNCTLGPTEHARYCILNAPWNK